MLYFITCRDHVLIPTQSIAFINHSAEWGKQNTTRAIDKGTFVALNNTEIGKNTPITRSTVDISESERDRIRTMADEARKGVLESNGKNLDNFFTQNT